LSSLRKEVSKIDQAKEIIHQVTSQLKIGIK
jgi:hypothetical protein